NVAAEMERRGLDLPLLVGGATTSRIHTALKVTPAYERAPVVHVADASRAAGVISKLLGADAGRQAFLDELDVEYQRVIDAHERAEVERRRLTLVEARRNAPEFRFDPSTVAAPTYTGARAVEGLDLAELVDYIDWTP